MKAILEGKTRRKKQGEDDSDIYRYIGGQLEKVGRTKLGWQHRAGMRAIRDELAQNLINYPASTDSKAF